MVGCFGGYAGGLHLLLALGRDEVVVFGVAEAEGLLEIDVIGMLGEEEVATMGVVALTVEVWFLLKVLIRLILSPHYLTIINSDESVKYLIQRSNFNMLLPY